jgi:DNA repair exonuclease SbcCD ATPase subunit
VSKKSKAWLAASRQMAEAQGYYTTLGPRDLEEWLAAQQDQHSDTWDVIWKAARRAEWEKCQDDQEVFQARVAELEASNSRLATNQLQLAETAKKRLERGHWLEVELKYATGQLVARNKELADAQQAATTARSYTSMAQQRCVKLLRSNQTLRSQNENLKQQLVKATALTTEGTRNLQGRYDKLLGEHQLGERLYEQLEKENGYNQNALDLAEQELSDTREKLLQERTAHVQVQKDLDKEMDFWRKKYLAIPPIASRKPEGDGWVLSWSRITGQPSRGR